MGYKIGDRFKCDVPPNIMVWEIISICEPTAIGYGILCIESTISLYKPGIVSTSDFDSKYWTYIGNFAKDSNFEELYNLFNS